MAGTEDGLGREGEGGRGRARAGGAAAAGGSGRARAREAALDGRREVVRVAEPASGRDRGSRGPE